MQSTDSLRELNAKLLVEITELRKENAEIPELREKLLKFAEVEAEKVKLRRELEAKNDELYKTIADFSSKIGKLNAEIVELKKDKTAITKLESEHAEFRDRVTKVEQRQMHDDNSSNFNSVADQVSKANSHHEKPLVDKEMDTLLPEELIPEMIAKQSASAVNIPVMEQCDQTSLEDKETDAFLNEMHKKKVSDEIRQRNREKKLLHESANQEASSISQDISSVKGHDYRSSSKNSEKNGNSVTNRDDRQKNILVITTSQENNDDDIEFTKSQVIEQELTKELLSDIISVPSISFEAEMLEHLPGITLGNLRMRTLRAKKIRMLFGEGGVGIDKIKQVTFSVYDISSLTINQIQSVIKNVTSAPEVPNRNHVTSVTNCDDQINAPLISAEITTSHPQIPMTNPTYDRSYFRKKILDQYPNLYRECSSEIFDYYVITDETSCGVSRKTICPLCKLGHDDEEIEGRYKAGSYFIKCEQHEIEITA